MNSLAKTINDRLAKAGPLNHRIIGVYGCEVKPAGAVTVGSVIRNGHPCLAKALFKMSTHQDIPAIYVSKDAAKESCPGSMMWFGFMDFPPQIERMFSSDSPAGDSMCIKRTSKLCAATLRDMGKFTPAGKYLVLQVLDKIDDGAGALKSILCFGSAGQIRNLGALIHFGESRAFTPIMAPWGSGCATFVAFPAGMASDCPKDTAFISPVVPEANSWLPADLFALAIPIDMAVRMAEGYESSFAVRKPETTYPNVKEDI